MPTWLIVFLFSFNKCALPDEEDSTTLYERCATLMNPNSSMYVLTFSDSGSEEENIEDETPSLSFQHHQKNKEEGIDYAEASNSHVFSTSSRQANEYRLEGKFYKSSHSSSENLSSLEVKNRKENRILSSESSQAQVYKDPIPDTINPFVFNGSISFEINSSHESSLPQEAEKKDIRVSKKKVNKIAAGLDTSSGFNPFSEGSPYFTSSRDSTKISPICVQTNKGTNQTVRVDPVCLAKKYKRRVTSNGWWCISGCPNPFTVVETEIRTTARAFLPGNPPMDVNT